MMDNRLTEVFDNISYESAEEIAKKYEAAVQNVGGDFQTRVYIRVMFMSMINENIGKPSVNPQS